MVDEPVILYVLIRSPRPLAHDGEQFRVLIRFEHFEKFVEENWPVDVVLPIETNQSTTKRVSEHGDFIVSWNQNLSSETPHLSARTDR